MGASNTASTDQRQIRVFLSSTFVDFMEERELLVKRVFPALNRRARERGVEIVDVDLRWGVTQQQTEQGQTLPLCLAEIERCRPYFIGLLGERYGWVPPAEYFSKELLEQQPWLREQCGGASVTELEILHGVLRNPEMAGYARFYFRDPAYAEQQGEAGWLAQSPQDSQRLQVLKDRIRQSGFPVLENLQDPQAIAERIETDLWEVIDTLYPDQEQLDALAREERKHASYRQARLEVYLDAAGNVRKLDELIKCGEQQILICGDSGSGKSALIANWIAQHQQADPEDQIHAHHLGFTNDANTLRPLLARLIESASALLLADELISEAPKIPEDWWELVAQVATTLVDVGRWARRQGRRWILVLDGIDRLPDEDQNALAWLPPIIPADVQVVVSALPCKLRELLLQRNFTTLAIGPLQQAEQEALIERYLARYTKQLEAGLQQAILQHPQASSPLFLRVLLEELRQCGRFDTLNEQLAYYLSAQTIDALYGRVLQRLEEDVNMQSVHKLMSTLWASRAGLTEGELLEITQVPQLQWTPIELGLEKALGRNGNRLVFGNRFLRNAIQNRYLHKEEQRLLAHSDLVDWFRDRENWDERSAEEWPWQLQHSKRLSELRELLLTPDFLASLICSQGSREVLDYWQTIRTENDLKLDEFIITVVESEIDKRRNKHSDLIWFINQIADLLDEAGLFRKPLLNLRLLSVTVDEESQERDTLLNAECMLLLGETYWEMGHYQEALDWHLKGHAILVGDLGRDHIKTLSSLNSLGVIYNSLSAFEQSESCHIDCLTAQIRILGEKHPHTLTSMNNLALLYIATGDYEKAEDYCIKCLQGREYFLGMQHPLTGISANNMGLLYAHKEDYQTAEIYYKRCLELNVQMLGLSHPSTLTSLVNLGMNYLNKGDFIQSEECLAHALKHCQQQLGHEHPQTLVCLNNLGGLYLETGNLQNAELYLSKALNLRKRTLGNEHPETLSTIHNLAGVFRDMGDKVKAEKFYRHVLRSCLRVLGPDHPDTRNTRSSLADLLSDEKRYDESIYLWREELAVAMRSEGPGSLRLSATSHCLAEVLRLNNSLEESEWYYRLAIITRIAVLGEKSKESIATCSGLARTLSDMGRHWEAIDLRQTVVEWCKSAYGLEHPDTLFCMNELASDLYSTGELGRSENLYRIVYTARVALLGLSHPATMESCYCLAKTLSAMQRVEEAIELRRIELAWCQNNIDIDVESKLISMYDLACDLLCAEECEEALELLHECFHQQQLKLGLTHENTLSILDSLLEALRTLGRQHEAISLSCKAYNALLFEYGEWHPDVLGQISNQANLYEELGQLKDAEALYRRYLDGCERIHGLESSEAMAAAYNLAEVLSAQECHAEAIHLRRRELAWCLRENGGSEPDTLTSFNQLAIDLREIGELKEAEELFREILVRRYQVLEKDDSEIARALGGLAKTLEAAGKLDDALCYAQLAHDHRLQYEGTDNWFTNQSRFDLARLLHKLDRPEESILLLNALQNSLNAKDDPDEDDDDLLKQAAELRREIESAMSQAGSE